MKVWEGKQVVVSYYLQQQQEDDIEEERNETLHQMKLSSIIIYLVRLHWRPIRSYSSNDPQGKKSEA